MRIVTIDALFVMKTISCRKTDIRDIFMLVSDIKDRDWIKKEIKQRYNVDDRLAKIEEKITSKGFRDGIQSVFGKINDKIFEKHKKLISRLKE